MQKALRYLVIFTIPLFIIFSFTLQFTFDESFYLSEFDKYDLYDSIDVDKDELPMIVKHLVDYLKNRTDEFNLKAKYKDGTIDDVYGEREVLHMIDVKVLFNLVRYYVYFFGGFYLLYLAWLIKTDKVVEHLSYIFIRASILTVLIGVFLGILSTVDFNKYFVIFHEIFFDNDLWLLNPRTDVLIQMLPLNFFIDMVMRIITYTAVSIVTMALAGIALRNKFKKSNIL